VELEQEIKHLKHANRHEIEQLKDDSSKGIQELKHEVERLKEDRRRKALSGMRT
jgi:hypothetical protein